MSFEKLQLIEPLLKALKSEGYSSPTPIQEQAIPIVLQKRDLLGCAQTGTGKTAAFALPILQILHQNELYKKGPHGPKALILTPTRELAIQIGDSFSAYGKLLRIRHTVIYGGVGQKPQTDALRSGVEVIIATPGRLLDLMDQKFVDLRHIHLFTLDEADRMLDMGFIHDVKKIIARLPVNRQTLLFSATMPNEIQSLANSILKDPAKVAVTPVSSTVDRIAQQVYFIEKADKRKLLIHLLKNTGIESALVFTRTKHGADRVARDLTKAKIFAQAIHGNKSQTARQAALTGFKSGKLKVLVATDIAARGIDVENLSHVINFEISNVPETYVHRIGRTGRAGATGIAISFCDREERAYLRDIQKLIGKSIPVVTTPELAGVSIPESTPDHKANETGDRGNRNHFKPSRQNKSRHHNSDKRHHNGDKKSHNNDNRNHNGDRKNQNGDKGRHHNRKPWHKWTADSLAGGVKNY